MRMKKEDNKLLKASKMQIILNDLFKYITGNTIITIINYVMIAQMNDMRSAINLLP